MAFLSFLHFALCISDGPCCSVYFVHIKAHIYLCTIKAVFFLFYGAHLLWLYLNIFMTIPTHRRSGDGGGRDGDKEVCVLGLG